MSMDRAEQEWLEEPKIRCECWCGCKLRNGKCPSCDSPDYNSDEEIDNVG